MSRYQPLTEEEATERMLVLPFHSDTYREIQSALRWCTLQWDKQPRWTTLTENKNSDAIEFTDGNGRVLDTRPRTEED